jgi:hypothetical protein
MPTTILDAHPQEVEIKRLPMAERRPIAKIRLAGWPHAPQRAAPVCASSTCSPTPPAVMNKAGEVAPGRATPGHAPPLEIRRV